MTDYKKNSLCKQVVEALQSEGFKLFKDKQSNKWISLYCNSKAYGAITGYTEELNSLTGEFIKSRQPAFGRMPYEYQKALHNIINKAYIRVDDSNVYFSSKGVDLDGLEKELSFKVKEILEKHVYLLKLKLDPNYSSFAKSMANDSSGKGSSKDKVSKDA